jgi:hypothetical protein
VRLKHFGHISEALACYIATGTSVFDHNKKLVRLENIYSFAGEFLWDIIHCTDGSRELWHEFVKRTSESGLKGWIIVASGLAAVITIPLECISNITENAHIAVAKHGGNIHSIGDVLFSYLPRKLLLVLGLSKDQDEIDYKSELKSIFEVLRPNDTDVNYDDYIYKGGLINSIDGARRCNVEVIGCQSTLSDVAEKIESIQEPYILIFSGHGLYNYLKPDENQLPLGYFDGKLYLYKDDRTLNVSHDEFSNMLKKNPPFGIIFNCCNGVRKIQCNGTLECETGHAVSDDIFENYYLKFRGKTKFIMVFRSKIVDRFAREISNTLVTSLQKKLHIADFLINTRLNIQTMVQIEDAQGFGKNQNNQRLIRERSSGIFWIL